MFDLCAKVPRKHWWSIDTADSSSCSLEYQEVAYVQPEVTHLYTRLYVHEILWESTKRMYAMLNVNRVKRNTFPNVSRIGIRKQNKQQEMLPVELQIMCQIVAGILKARPNYARRK